jgi:rhamnosyltransferase
MPPSAPQVSVVIPTKNAGARFEETLEAIRHQDGVALDELVVIDSGSADATLQRCTRYGARVIEIRPADFGHGRTRNQAIATTRAEYIALLVQDAVPADSNWLASLVAALESRPRAAGAYSRHCPHPGASFVARQVTEYWYRHQGGRVEQAMLDPVAFQHQSLEAKQLQCTFNNVSSLIRRSAWERCPFREMPFAEDLAWGYDVLRAGHTVIYEPNSVVRHSHERRLRYELRRSYVASRFVGELFDEPAQPAHAYTVMLLLPFWRRIEARSRALDARGAADLAAVLRQYIRDEAWYRRHFDAIALHSIWGPTSPYPREEQEDLFYLLPRAGAAGAPAAKPTKASARNTAQADHSLAARVRAFVWARSDCGVPALLRQDLDAIFDAFWNHIGRDYVRRAVLENVGNAFDGYPALAARVAPFEDRAFPALEERMRLTAGGLLVEAAKEDILTPALYRDVWRYTGAVVIGARLGEANRYGLGGRWGRALHSGLARCV